MTLYAVRIRRCGCLVSSSPAKNQAATIGAQHEHNDGSTTTVMHVADAARVREHCDEHRGRRPSDQAAAADQQRLF